MPRILQIFKAPKNIFIFLGVSVLVFDVQYYLMANLPGSANLQCIPGGNLTMINVIFSIALSILAGVMIVSLIELAGRRSMKREGASWLGLMLGMLTAFCTACTIPVISLFGLSFSLVFFTEYELYFKLASVGLMLWGLYLLNRQL